MKDGKRKLVKEEFCFLRCVTRFIKKKVLVVAPSPTSSYLFPCLQVTKME